MSKTFRQQLQGLAQAAGGSFKTRDNRKTIIERFADYLKEQNIQIQSVGHIKTSHIEGYIGWRLANDISKRTLHNEMAAIRAVLAQAGRRLAQSEQLSNKGLGLDGATRRGSKRAISEERYQEFRHAAQSRDKGFAAALMLSRALGLRAEEAVQANKSLDSWARQVEAGKGSVTVIFGTKTGKPREAAIHNRERVAVAVAEARQVAREQGGKIIDKPNLKSAMDRFHNLARAIGMEEKESPHALRYAYAQEGLKNYRERGFSEREARALVSCDLGHGDGRGRYVASVYGGSDDNKDSNTGEEGE